ncbi:MAG: riboflavin biosynthesis protein RibF [Pseudomonadota bacterium]
MIGNFDGFHRGHQEVAKTALRLAATMAGQRASEEKAEVWLLTFDPHPRIYFGRRENQSTLSSLKAEIRLAEALALTGIQTLTFDERLASKTPEEFIADTIVATMQADGVVVGHDFRFGKKRAGDVELLRAHGGFQVVEVDAFADEGGETISSTRIRALLSEGKVAEANGLLGYHYFLVGTVEHGDKRGRQLGYPTANIAPMIGGALSHGIYATTIKVGDTVYPSVASYGRRPTFGDKPPLLEIHLFDFTGDLYGREVEVAFHAHLRSEMKFDGPEALITQMDRDSAEARAVPAGAMPLSSLDHALGLVHPTNALP